MARLQAVRREQIEGADVEPQSGTGGVVAVLLFVVAVAALGEVVASRAVTIPRCAAPAGQRLQAPARSPRRHRHAADGRSPAPLTPPAALRRGVPSC
jgi:hypothetical protein